MCAADVTIGSTQFFATAADFRAWLAEHHATNQEQWVGYYKKSSGTPSITWPESVDAALCYGWIDGQRKSIDEARYRIRFTPRRPRSIWSAVNISRVAELSAEGRMQPAGLRAYELRRAEASGIYAHEQRHHLQLTAAELEQFQSNPAAWAFFQNQPPGYQHAAAHWVLSAKQATTRARRLMTLIEDSASELRIAALRR